MTAAAESPYEVLYVEHAPAARRLALSLVPPHVADDVVAEAFARVLDTTSRNGPPAAFRPYLMAAVRNTARTYHSRGARLVPVPDVDPGPVSGPLRALVEREDARLAGQALGSLPERWRQVLWATAVEEVTIAALANRWGMTANSVSQLASRAREGLRQAYLNAHLGSDMPEACREVAPYMGASVRGRAGKRHAARLVTHLRGCERCAQAHAGLASINTRLGEILVPAAAGSALLSHVLPVARAAGRGWRWHATAAATVAAGAAVTVSAMVAVPFTAPVPGGGAQARAQAAASPPGDGGSVIASASPVSAVSGLPRVAAAGTPAPAAATARPPADPAPAAAPAAPADPPAGLSVTGFAPGTAYRINCVAGRPVPGAVQPVAGAADSAAAGAGQAVDGAVQDATGTAGSVVQAVTGTSDGPLSGS